MTRPKLFLDDTRQPPEADMLLARDGVEFDEMLEAHKATGFSEIYFDHDLGYNVGNGHECLEHLIERCELEGYPHPDVIYIHTMNKEEWHKMAFRAAHYFPDTVTVRKIDGRQFLQRDGSRA